MEELGAPGARALGDYVTILAVSASGVDFAFLAAQHCGAMQTVSLGKRGPKAARIGFGAWAIGGSDWGKSDDDQSRKALHAALDRGVTFIDTADVYGFGHSEELIRQVLAERPADDDPVVVATKAGNDFSDAMGLAGKAARAAIRPNYSKAYLVGAAERSLRRLGVEALDLLQLHSPDTATLTTDEPWEALAELKAAGKIRSAGLSIQTRKETEQAPIVERWAQEGVLDVVQVRYNLLERSAEKLLFPRCIENGVGVITRVPLLFGALTGKFTRDTRFAEDDHRSRSLSVVRLSEYLDDLEAMKELFAAHPTQTMAQVAIRFCITHPACHVTIPGAKTPEQVLDNCRAGDFGPLQVVIPPLPDYQAGARVRDGSLLATGPATPRPGKRD